MCGLFGIAGAGICSTDLKVFQGLAIFSMVRGTDSTGVFKCGYNGSGQKILKNTKASPIFVLENRDFIEDFQTYCMLGHVRDSTVGKIDIENAHPYMFTDIVGAHNGTLRDSRYRMHRHRTDSSMMFEDMNTRGVVPVLEELDPESAYAISVYHRDDYALTFARNRARPLHVALHNKRNTMYWASEYEILEFALNRLGVDAKVYEFSADKVYRVPIKDIKAGTSPWEITKLTLKKLAAKPRKKVESFDRALWDKLSEEKTTTEDYDKCTYCSRKITPEEIASGSCSHMMFENIPYYNCTECTQLYSEGAH